MNESYARERWTRHGLPERIDGQSFLDVGCWEGAMCVEALERGASNVLGIDYCTSPELAENQARSGFDFIQMDVVSEKLLQLPEYDVVYSAGVLYHMESPLSYLYRLRKLCRPGGLVVMETSCFWDNRSGFPLMLYHPRAEFDDNPSNWWSPNEACVLEMMAEAGFSELTVTDRVEPSPYYGGRMQIGRVTVRGVASSSPARLSLKVLPRRPAYMPSAPGQGSRS